MIAFPDSTKQDVVHHVSGYLQARDLNPDNIISSSWCRSVIDYGLDPSQKDLRTILSTDEVRDQTADIQDFFHIAKVGTQNLAQRLTGAGYAVILTNSKGVTLYSSCHSNLGIAWSKADNIH